MERSGRHPSGVWDPLGLLAGRPTPGGDDGEGMAGVVRGGGEELHGVVRDAVVDLLLGVQQRDGLVTARQELVRKGEADALQVPWGMGGGRNDKNRDLF